MPLRSPSALGATTASTDCVEVPDPVNRTRAALEVLTLLAVADLWYWASLEFNKADWDWPTLEERVNGDAWNFDSNSFLFNSWIHPIDGAMYHLAGRTNGLSYGESFAIDVLSSATWEWFIEFPERISINDLMLTPGGGAPIGEVAHRLGQYFNSGPVNGTGRETASVFLGPLHAAHRWADDSAIRSDSELDWLGYSAEIWHAFHAKLIGGVHVGGDANPDGVYAGAHISLAFADFDRYRRGAHRTVWFHDAEVVDGVVALTMTPNETDEIFALARVLPVGLLFQQIDANDAGLVGWEGILGLHTSYTLNQAHADIIETDLRGIWRMLGLEARVEGWWGPLHVAFRGAATPDFAAISSLSRNEFGDRHGTDPIKTLILQNNYFYAFGGSLDADLKLSLAGFTVGGQLYWGEWQSIDGLDRYQELLIDEASGDESWLRWGVEASYTFARPIGLSLGIGYLEDVRQGSLGPVESEVLRSARLTGDIGLVF